MSAELLRRAAKELREHAQAAIPGPWEADGSEIQQPYGAEWVAESLRVSDGYGIDDVGDANASYIALMHPPVALALADLLDGCAAAEDPDVPLMPVDHKLLALARALLREEATSA